MPGKGSSGEAVGRSVTRRIGLIGFPVEHSLSPAFQQVALNALNIDATYELWPTPAGEVAARIESLREPDVIGANVTVPHKERAFALVDSSSDRASLAGAVNTIVNRGGHLFGDNTDIPGFLAPLEERGIEFESARPVVLGAGGAARGIVVALMSAGCSRIVVANRTLERAIQLQTDLGVEVVPIDLHDDLTSQLSDATLLVNTTAVGWDDDQLPVRSGQLANLPAETIVYDLTYRATALLRAASERGNEVIDGLPMLVHQGAESFRLWTGLEPPVAMMTQAALQARRRRG